MKFLALLGSLVAFVSHGAIIFDSKEYDPGGKHYTAKINRLYYAEYPKVTGDRVTVLYYKTSTGLIMFKGMWVSKSMSGKLPLIVQKYIGKYITDIKFKETHSVQKAVEATRVAVDRALDQKYKDLLLKEGKKLLEDSAYYRGYCNTKWWTPEYYYDFKPLFSKDSVKLFLTNSITDSKFLGLKYVSDSLNHFGYHHDDNNLSSWGEIFKKVRSSTKRTIKDYGYTRKPIKDDTSYHKRIDSCRFSYTKVSISHGKRYPVFASVSIFGWHATYCNYFASDLRKAVFGSAIWKTNGCEKDSEYLQADVKSPSPNFVEIKKSDMLKYADAGFFVFAIDKGHITTVFPDGKSIEINDIHYPSKVIQAGDKTGIVELVKVWNGFVGDKTIKVYLYLGHLK